MKCYRPLEASLGAAQPNQSAKKLYTQMSLRAPSDTTHWTFA